MLLTSGVKVTNSAQKREGAPARAFNKPQKPKHNNYLWPAPATRGKRRLGYKRYVELAPAHTAALDRREARSKRQLYSREKVAERYREFLQEVVLTYQAT